MAEITALKTPAANPAQSLLQTDAIEGANWLKKGEYSSKPGNIFFDFEMPGKQLDSYKKTANVNQGGTFALANNEGRSKATGVQSKYLGDKFARDVAQNYQSNIGQSAGNIRNALTQSSGAASGTNSSVINALGGIYSSLLSKPKTPGFDWGSLLQLGGQIGSAAITKF